jgi:GGDEF domain-containing protein
MVFRWGGEEFVILLPRTSLDTAMQIAESSVQPLPALRFRAYRGLPSALAWRGITRGEY